MSDLELDLLRAWTPEPVAVSAEVRAHARAALHAAYVERAPLPHRAPATRRFGKRFAIAALAAAVLVAGGLVWVQRQVDDRVDHIKTVTVPNGALGSGEVGHGPVNVLLVGSDRRDGTHPAAFGTPADTGPPRSDTMILLHIDGAHVRALWIPRDLIVGGDRINAAFNRGAQNLVDTIKSGLGVTIDHYAEVNFAGFVRIVDELDGVPIYSPGHVRDAYSGVDLTGPGCRTLDGAAALAWVRSRHLEIEQNGMWVDASPHADLDRQTRQQDFMRALARKVQAKVGDDPEAAVRVVDAVIPALKIDSRFTKSEIFGFVRALIGVDPGTAQLSTLPVQTASDGTTVVLRQPDAETALAPFKAGPTPTGPPPPGIAGQPSPAPVPDC
ncbi:MAG: LCP family protein [Acidimicrobiia bacterium]